MNKNLKQNNLPVFDFIFISLGSSNYFYMYCFNNLIRVIEFYFVIQLFTELAQIFQLS